jgi:glycosyltransferase 2 family protein
MTKRRFKWFTLIRLLGIVIFLVVLSRTDLKELWNWLEHVSIPMLLLALLFQVLLLFFKCIRWYFLNETGLKAKAIYQRFGEFLEAYAVGVVTPGRMGEILKAGHAVGRTQVVSAGLLVIAERGLDLSLFFLMAGIAPAMGYLSGVSSGLGYLLIGIAIIGIFLSFSILIFPAVLRIIGSILIRFRIFSSDQLLTFVPRNSLTLINFSFLSVLGNLCAFLSFYYTALAVMISIGFMPVSGGVALAGVINTIPVTIMGVGTRDVTLLYVMNQIPKAQVLAFSGLILLVSQIGGGLIALVSGQYFLFKAKRH